VRRRRGASCAAAASSAACAACAAISLHLPTSAFTCLHLHVSASQVRRRFEALGAPLVVGAEKKWWPRRDYARNPYPPTHSGLRYPNSGLLIGTAKGFEQLQPAYAAMPQVGLGSGLGMGFRTPR